MDPFFFFFFFFANLEKVCWRCDERCLIIGIRTQETTILNRERTRSDLVNEEWIMDKTKRRRQDRTKAVERGTNRHVVMFDLQMKFVVFSRIYNPGNSKKMDTRGGSYSERNMGTEKKVSERLVIAGIGGPG